MPTKCHDSTNPVTISKKGVHEQNFPMYEFEILTSQQATKLQFGDILVHFENINFGESIKPVLLMDM